MPAPPGARGPLRPGGPPAGAGGRGRRGMPARSHESEDRYEQDLPLSCPAPDPHPDSPAGGAEQELVIREIGLEVDRDLPVREVRRLDEVPQPAVDRAIVESEPRGVEGLGEPPSLSGRHHGAVDARVRSAVPGPAPGAGPGL